MNRPPLNGHPWIRSLQSGCLAMALVLITLVSWGQEALATGVYEIPPVTSGQAPWVIDQGEVLSRSTQGSLNRKLENLAQSTGIETRFVTIRWLDYGVTIDEFAHKLFDQWYPTEADKSQQAVMVLDTKTNTIALVAAEDVTPALPEATAQSIAQETALIPIRKGSYNQGLLDAGDRLGAVLSGEPDPGPPVIEVAEVESTFKSAEETDTKSATLIVVVLLILATVIPMVTYYWYQGQ
ncbi:photosystem II repair protein Psb32 [Lyngbya confervoides]|uniref:TPM domain-containing protein n=1 Tax=Lyngbya confervoides BDU141951 TaxID=1574623 RepID=A0ABD4T213_9CYAN|nr:TPM domain-containing protein [Lyngbya confervoides]MCM1982666.1 TPM domain-containing protein [Lyngbya confervoides BDU141951]